MKRWGAWVAKAIASCGFLTYLPARYCGPDRKCTGAGMIGTFAGLATASALHTTNRWTAVIIWCGGLLAAVAISEWAEQAMGRHDDPRIVIDEWIGYWTAILWLPQTPAILIAAFILFRIFDVWKPLGIERLAKWPGGWGIVMDDVAAGLYTNLILRGLLLWLPR